MRRVKITTSLVHDGINTYIALHRGHWATMKIRLDEATGLADLLVDLVEQETKRE